MINTHKEKIRISVILPVYNVEPWIDKCIESLKKQKLSGLEFIFVDDRGTDNSMRIVEAWAEEDERVRIIHNPQNMGSGPSRNAGIKAACGEYYSFIDPDDCISDDFYNLLYSKAKETGCDIVKGVRISFNGDDDISPALIEMPRTSFNYRIRMMLKMNWPLYNCFTYEHQTAIYKASLFEDECVRYGSSRVAQDVTFLLRICYNTDNIAFQESAFYFYRQRAGAVTSSYTLTRAAASMQSVEESAAYLKNQPGFPSVFHSQYLFTKMKGAHDLYCYAPKAKHFSSSVQDEYRQCTLNLVKALEPSNRLMHVFPEMHIFLNYNYCIPSNKKKGDRVLRDCLVQWTNFFQEHPDARNTSYYRGYATAMLRAIASFYRIRTESLGALKTGLRFTREQIKRLSRKDRFMILINSLPCGVSALLTKMTMRKTVYLKEIMKNKLKRIPFVCKAYRYYCVQKERVLAISQFNNAKKKQPLICEGSPEAFHDMPLHVQWEITQYCNFNCSYCFQAKGRHKNKYCSLEQAKKAIEHMVSANRPSYQIYLLGGEPLSHPNLIEIVKLIDEYLGDKIQVMRFLTNGSFKPGQFEELIEAARHFPLLLSISFHFEFNKPERIISFVKEYANKTPLELGLMFHPEYFDELKETAAWLTELRKEYPFSILINMIHEPPAFQRLDSRYTDEHFEWAKAAKLAFDLAATEGPDVKHDRSTEFGRSRFFTERETASGIERIEYESYEDLDEDTNADFSGMYCCSGTMILTINTSGTVKGTRCPAAPTICNIFEENPYERDDWMYAHPCTRAWCSDVSNRRTAKFRSKRAAKKYLKKCKKKQADMLRQGVNAQGNQ